MIWFITLKYWGSPSIDHQGARAEHWTWNIFGRKCETWDMIWWGCGPCGRPAWPISCIDREGQEEADTIIIPSQQSIIHMSCNALCDIVTLCCSVSLGNIFTKSLFYTGGGCHKDYLNGPLSLMMWLRRAERNKLHKKHEKIKIEWTLIWLGANN